MTTGQLNFIRVIQHFGDETHK